MENTNDQFMCSGNNTFTINEEKKSVTDSNTPFMATSSSRDCPFLLYELPIAYKQQVSSAYDNLMWVNRIKTRNHPVFNNKDIEIE